MSLAATNMYWMDHVLYAPQQDPVLQQGDRGDAVRELQATLKDSGYRVSLDGHFGPQTQRTVMAFQRHEHLVADGRVGPKTQRALERLPSESVLLSQKDIEDAARELDVDVASVMALNEIESRGSGFTGPKYPVILFERHIMRRRLEHHGINATPYVSSHPHLVNTRTGGYIGGEKEHERLAEASTLHSPSAHESASWGLFQIMGFHWRRLGFASIDAYVEAMCQNERQQLMAFVTFIKTDTRLHASLKQRDWDDVAYRYNGPAYRKNRYGVKLREAYAKYKAV